MKAIEPKDYSFGRMVARSRFLEALYNRSRFKKTTFLTTGNHTSLSNRGTVFAESALKVEKVEI